MHKYFRNEMHRAFVTWKFPLVLAVAMGICIWHFLENVYPLRNYVYLMSYPLSAFGKWIGGENTSVQPTLYYLLMPILCALPFGRTYDYDLKSGYINQLIIRGEKREYLKAKLLTAFFSGTVISGIPLLFDFLLTGTILPAVVPQSGTGLFPIISESVLSELYYMHPYIYTFIYWILDMVYFGLFNTICLWAVDFVENQFWIMLFPFMVYLFIFCTSQFVGYEIIAPFFFLRPSQPICSKLSIILTEIVLLLVGNMIFYLVHKKRERRL